MQGRRAIALFNSSDNVRDILQQHYRGSRYNFGYPACPNIEDQYKQLDLVDTSPINM